MKILVVSSIRDAREVLNRASPGARELFHCAEWTMARRLLNSRFRSVDWVLVERTAMVTEDPRPTEPLRVMDFSSDYGPRACSGSGACHIGWNESGVLELHCQQRQPDPIPRQVSSIPDTRKPQPPVYFEYQAPCRKRNR